MLQAGGSEFPKVSLGYVSFPNIPVFVCLCVSGNMQGNLETKKRPVQQRDLTKELLRCRTESVSWGWEEPTECTGEGNISIWGGYCLIWSNVLLGWSWHIPMEHFSFNQFYREAFLGEKDWLMLFSWCLGCWPHFKSMFCLIQNDLKNLCEQKKKWGWEVMV